MTPRGFMPQYVEYLPHRLHTDNRFIPHKTTLSACYIPYGTVWLYFCHLRRGKGQADHDIAFPYINIILMRSVPPLGEKHQENGHYC